jgi:hypothetical protein
VNEQALLALEVNQQVFASPGQVLDSAAANAPSEADLIHRAPQPVITYLDRIKPPSHKRGVQTAANRFDFG